MSQVTVQSKDVTFKGFIIIRSKAVRSKVDYN